MATVIDELILKLGIDASSFKRDASSTQAAVAQTGNVARREGRALEEVLVKTQGETTKRMRQVEEVGRGAAQGFTRLKNEVVGLLGAIAGAYGLQQFIRNVTNSDAAVGYLAKTIGIAVEDLSAWQEAAKRSGGSAEATGASMRAMSQEIQHFMLHGQTAMMPTLRQLQAMPGAVLALKDAFGQATPVTELYLALADRFSKMDIRRAIAMGADLNIDEGTVRMLAQGRGAVIGRVAEMKRLGVVNQPDVDAAIRLQAAWDSLQQAVTRLGNAILTDFNKPLVAAINELTEWAVEARKTGGALSDIEGVIRAFVEWLKDVGSGIEKVVGYMGGWKTVTETLFGLWVLSKVSPIITLILGLATAMGSLATATAAVDVAAGGSGIKMLLGAGALAGGAYGVNMLLEKLEEMVYGKTATDQEKEFREKHSPIRNFIRRQLGWSDPSRDEGSAQEFHDKTYADLKAEAERRNLPHPEVIASLGAAQASVESTNGTSDLAMRSNNLFGIKPGTPGGVGESGRSGDYVAFASRERAASGYIDFITKNPRYAGALSATSVPDAASALAGAGYAEDPNYQAAIADRYRRYGGIRTAPNIAKPGPTFGPQMAPTSALDPGMRFALRPGAASSVDNSRSNTSTAETHIGAITVNTAATDAEGVAKGIGGALRRYQFVPESNYGLA